MDCISEIWGDGKIWQSDAVAAHDKEVLSKRRIRRVLDLSGGGAYELPEGCQRVAVELEDRCDSNLTSVLDVCFECIDAAADSDSPILVHCEHGKSRSSACIIAWLMKREGMSLALALNHCKRRRSRVRPNNGFFKELRALDVLYNGRDSMPLNDMEYAAWCLSHPNGTKDAQCHLL
mmetsp:Transcript_33987/g.107917  ORF Transcript_33987/g.107917 Transcript_33987/m.107917 type:complete len:177 (+) Transcript_33987:160-690(+)